jgi:peroxiredoxin
MRRSLALAVLVLLGSIAASSGEDRPKKATIGEPVPDFRMRDVMKDEPVLTSLSQFKGKTVVLFFVSDKCQVTWAYERRTGKLIQDFRKDVVFLGVKSSARDSADEIKGYCEQKNFDIPVLCDDRNVVADYFGFRSTPQYAVIDKDGVLRYFGAFDDLQSMRTWQQKEETAKVQYVRDALTAVLAGKDVQTKTAKGYG